MTKTQFIYLAALEHKEITEQCDICIVGAGAAGIYLATRLAAKGLNIILLEAGDKAAIEASSFAGMKPLFDADLYPGATIGRYIGVGGTTTHWGGVLIPHTQYDVRPTIEGFDPWSHIVETVKQKSAVVLENLGWQRGDDFFDFARKDLNELSVTLEAAGLRAASNLMMPFGLKNFSGLLKQKTGGGGRLRLYFNSVVNDFETKDNGAAARLCRLMAIAVTGNQITVSASRFIIAAGTIESARLLLELDQSSSGPVIRQGAQTGKFLADHLSVAIADVENDGKQEVIRHFAPRFDKSWLRSFRFVEKDTPADAPRAFAHFIFDSDNPGFTLAKEIFGAMQQRRLPKITLGAAIAGIGGMSQLAIHKYARSRLYVAPDTKIHLQLDIEQKPQIENGITLGEQRDRFGRRVAIIHWRISDEDRSRIETVASRLLSKWPVTNSSIPQLAARDVTSDATKPHDAYHPVGTCRLGVDKEAVVDLDLKVWGLENLWVVSTAVLPSAGTANPTFTMLCLAEELVAHLLTTGGGQNEQ